MADIPKWDDTEEVEEQTTQMSSADVPSFEDTQDFEDEQADEVPSEMGTAERFGRGVAQGASLGFADEATGGLQALLDQLKGTDKTLGQSYEQRRDESRAAYKEAQDTSDGAYGIGQLVGGAGTLLIPGLNAAKGATLAANAGKAALAGGLAGAGSSEAEDLGGLVEDTAKGAAFGGAAGSVFPLLGKLYKPAGSIGGAVAQGAGLTGVGAGIGGAYGALTEDLSTEEGRQAALDAAVTGATLAGASRLAVGAGRAIGNTGIGSQFVDDVKDAYKYGKQGVSLIGKAKDKIAKEVESFSDDVSKISDDILTAQKQGAYNKQLSASQALSHKVDNTRKLIGKEIGNLYNNPAKPTGNFTDELAELNEFLTQPNLNADEASALRSINKQVEKFKFNRQVPGETRTMDVKDPFGATVQKQYTDPSKTVEGFKDLNVKEYLNLRKEVADLAYGQDTPGSVRKLAKEFYKRLSDKGATTYLDETTAQEVLPMLNKEYSLLSSVDDLLGQGEYVTAQGGLESGPKAIKYVKNLGEETLAPAPLERTQSISKTLEEVDPALLDETKFQAKQAGKELRDVSEVEKLVEPTKLQRQVTDLEGYNPEVESASEYQKLLNQLAKSDASKAKGLLDRGQDLAKKTRLAGLVQKEGDKTVFSPRAAAFKALTSGATYGNLAGQALRSAEQKGYTSLAKALGSVLNKDAAGRNAVLFTIMQNPTLRKQYDEVMGTQGEEK